MEPYIGITDFENYDQAKNMLDFFSGISQRRHKRKLMVGVMMSYKTLNNIETKWAKAWPTNEQIGEIFKPHKYALNTLHYADFANQTKIEDLIEAVWSADRCNGLDALQFDMPWPSHVMVAELMDRFEDSKKRELQIIIQVGRVAIEQCGGNIDRVMDCIEWYRKKGACILFDLSGGNGIPMDTDFLRSYIRMTKDRFGPGTDIAVAGGLGPNTMHLIEPLLGEFPDMSIDAQGKLRPSGNPLDPIDWEMAKEYVCKAVELLP